MWSSNMKKTAELSSIELEFGQVLTKALSSGITFEQISSLKLLRQFNTPKRNFLNQIIKLLLTITAAAIVCRHSSIVFKGGIDRFCSYFNPIEEKFSRLENGYRLVYDNDDIFSENENYDTSDLESNYDAFDGGEEFEEIDDSNICEICEGISEVQRVTDITPEAFEQRFAYSGVPVVISDGMRGWSAPSVFSLDFFKGLYGNTSATLLGKRPGCAFFPYETGFQSLDEAFKMSPRMANLEEGSRPWYIGWSNCDASAASELRRHYSRPYFLPTDSELLNTDWIFMGSPGYGAPLHLDSVGYPSWQAQIKGSKLWLLEPPPECVKICKPLRVVVGQGEIVVLDTNLWYHETLILGHELSITIGAEYD